MKKIILQTGYIILISFFSISCDESFSPKTEFEEGYSLFCVIDGNSSYQSAYLTKNYSPEGLNSQNYNDDKSINDANITIICPDTTYKFRDTTLISSEDGKTYHSYYIEKFSNKPGELLLSATLPDMNEIRGSVILFDNGLRLGYTSTRDIVYVLRADYVVAFADITDPFYFMPSLYINYSVQYNGTDTLQRIEVSKSFYNNEGVEIPSYPDLVFRNGYNYSIELIEKTLRQISEAFPVNSIITIENFTLEILEVSDALAAYYTLNKTFIDGYTIKTQGPSYSNIEGGNGLFGYKFTHNFKINFHPDWRSPIIDMGYLFGN